MEHPETPTEITPSIASTPFSRRSLLKGTLAGAALGVVAPSTLTAWGQSLPSQARNIGQSTKTRTISVWTWYGDQGMPNNSPLGPAFEKAHPGVKVNIRTFGSTSDYTPALTAAIAGGDTPDIFAPSFGAVSYGKAGVALDLRKALGASFLSQFFEADNDQFSWDGKQFGLGWNAQSFGLYYEPALIEKANVAPPQSWEELIKAVPALRAAGLIPLSMPASPSYAMADFVGPLVTQASDDPTLLLKIDAQENGATWNNEAVVEALAKFQSLVKAKVFDPGLLATTYSGAENLLSSGKTAFMWDGSWAVADLGASAPDLKYAVAPTPAWTTGAKNWCGDQAGAALSVSASSPNLDDALDFIRFIFAPARYSSTLNANNAMPATKAAASTVSNPHLKVMTSWLLDGLGCPHILYGPGSETGLSNACVAIVNATQTPKEAAAAIQQTVDQAKNK
jgi:ABC-type glycerol-3-phosphate transport system substrate-binding protein